jgi:Na+/H+-dicarboxylate symporter
LVIDPASAVDLSSLAVFKTGTAPAVNVALTDTSNLPKRIVTTLFAANPFDAIAKGEMLQVVVFSALIGIGLLLLPEEKAEGVVSILAAIQEACMKLITLVVAIAPLAVFGLMVDVTTKIGFSVFTVLGGFAITVLDGLAVLLILYTVLLLLKRKSPLVFFSNIRNAQLIAFSTSSSAATLPITLQVAEEKLRLSKDMFSFVLPFCTFVNLNGTALFQAIAVVFLAGLFGIHLTFSDYFLITALTVAAAIGTPTVPSAGLVMLTTILVSIGVPAEAVLLILGVDRILDMCRTTVNVTGNLTLAQILDK